MALFQRQVVLQIGTEGAEGRQFQGLRCRFKVEMSKTSAANDAVIELYNPSGDSVALAQAPGAIVRLLVGYDVPQQVFYGNPVEGGVTLSRTGPDRILRIEAQDGGSNLQARVNTSFDSQTSAQQIFDEIAAQLGLASGTIRIGSMTLTQGMVLYGKAQDALDEFCRSLGLEWFVRDGALQVISLGGDTGEAAVVFSSSTKNLIGAPKKTKEGVEVTGLISPSLRPGKPFRVESAEIEGDYIAEDVTFVGDSGYETSFYVTVAGRPV
jgi:hypothetical protein